MVYRWFNNSSLELMWMHVNDTVSTRFDKSESREFLKTARLLDYYRTSYNETEVKRVSPFEGSLTPAGLEALKCKL